MLLFCLGLLIGCHGPRLVTWLMTRTDHIAQQVIDDALRDPVIPRQHNRVDG